MAVKEADAVERPRLRPASARRVPPSLIVVGLVVLTVALAVLSLGIGRFGLPLSRILEVVASGGERPFTVEEHAVLMAVRLPRICMALAVGAALAAAGAAFQGLFRNPLVSPDLLGVSSGASVGACLAILLGLSSLQVQLAAFVAALLAVLLVLAIGAAVGRTAGGSLLILVLAGVVIASLCGAITSLMKYLAPPDSTLPEITFWLMGSLGRTAGWRNAALLAGSLIIGGLPLLLMRWRLNALSFGEEEARSLGVDTARAKVVIIGAATLLTAVAVATCGVIGWVGLVIPHIARFAVGADYRTLLPVSMLTGSAFMLGVDNIARALTPGEIPLGIVTAILGAPVFIYLLFHGRQGWS